MSSHLQLEDEKKKKDAPLASATDVFEFGQGKMIYIIPGFILAIITGCAFPAMAGIFAYSFESIGGQVGFDGFLDRVREICYALLILGGVVFVCMTGQAMLFETAADAMTKDFREQWFRALLRQDMAYHDIKDVSGTATIITASAAKFKKGLGRKLGEMVQFSFTFLGGMAFAFYSSWRSSLVVLAVVPFMSAATLILVKINTTQSARAKETYAEAGSIVYTGVSSIRTVLSLNAVQKLIDNFKSATEKAYKGAASVAHLVGLANGAMMGSFLLSYVAITLYGSFLLYSDVRDTGCDPSGTIEDVDSCTPRGRDVFGSLMGIMFAAAVLPQVSVAMEAFVGARAAAYPALKVIRRTVGNDDEEINHSVHGRHKKSGNKSDDDDDKSSTGEAVPLPKYVIDSSSDEGKKPDKVVGEITFTDVSFAYPTRQDATIFNDFNLSVEAGTTVALVGPSGSGKSTTIQLIERFYDPLEGSVSLDGNDLKDLNVKWLREQIGLVSQEPNLFACSIRDNIKYGKPDATDEEIEEAAQLANCHAFIKSFPDGYDTYVGDQGTQLSGGQKQRIAIARVLIKKPKILLLDEATSALDSESERIVQEALDTLLKKGGRTTIVIAHRLSTIRDADKIVVVSEGKVVETGTHDELLDNGGLYRSLVDAQKDQAKDEDANGKRNSVLESKEFSQAFQAGSNAMFRFNSVHFCYPSRPENKIFRGLKLDIREGETLALVGPSGHGKSTIIQLIERFYDPDSGSVEFKGTDLKELNIQWLRDQIGLVSQEPTLFDLSIAENIRYALPDATMEQIEEAARKANIHNDIMEFPDKYDTMVGAGGTQVSGGQKQRIAIARALLKSPRVLLLDEATSALDSESEKVVQKALDEIMESKEHTCVVIAHRLSTIRNADRIAVIANGKVREIGTHDELMANPNSHYKRLKMYQNLDTDEVMKKQLHSLTSSAVETSEAKGKEVSKIDEEEIEKGVAAENAKRARLLSGQDTIYFVVGSIGACLAGAVFPGWGIAFSFLIELLYRPVFSCDNGQVFIPPFDQDSNGTFIDFGTCATYYDQVADEMQQRSFAVTGGFFGIIGATLFGNMLLFWGFNVASERMNRRIRNAAFESLMRQEVGYFDLTPTSILTSRMSDDAALIHSFSGEPIRTLVFNVCSVLVGLVIAFIYMWPFALIFLAILPFMGFGAAMEMRMYMGEDEAVEDDDENSPGSIVVESLLNIRTVAALSVEESRVQQYVEAIAKENLHPCRTNFVKGASAGVGQLVQMWGTALLFFWGGWLLLKYPHRFDFRDFLISMFGLLFSLSGMAVATQGATDRGKAKMAALRIFELMDRESAIDPLNKDGKQLA